jgi:hypothetical protein
MLILAVIKTNRSLRLKSVTPCETIQEKNIRNLTLDLLRLGPISQLASSDRLQSETKNETQLSKVLPSIQNLPSLEGTTRTKESDFVPFVNERTNLGLLLRPGM